MTTPQNSAADLPAEGYARVWDATATRGPRTHQIGESEVTFADHRTGVDVPIADARTVAAIPSFKVIGPSGERYLPVGQQPAEVLDKPRLRNDQVVASLDELALPALRTRAKAWATHADYAEAAGKADLVRFIMARLAEAPAKARGAEPESANEDDFEVPREDSDGDVVEVTKEQLAAINAAQRSTVSLAA